MINQENYCSLNVAQRLVDAGIVLETECFYDLKSELHLNRGMTGKRLVREGCLPAPCFAELLQELKKDVIFYGSNLYFSYQLLEQGFYSNSVKFSDDLGRIESPSFISDNPADALAELIIWVKEQEEGK